MSNQNQDKFDGLMDNYQEDIAIDPDKLDEEWLAQAQLFYKYNEYASDAILERDDAKADLDIQRSEAEKDIRNNPKDYDLEKITDKSVAAAVSLHENVRAATDRLNRAMHRVNILKDGAVRAFEHKKKALENLVILWQSNYFSGPTEPRVLKGGKYLLKEKNGQVSQDQRQSLNKRRRKN